MIYNCNDLSCSQLVAIGTPSLFVCVRCGFSFIKCAFYSIGFRISVLFSNLEM